MKACLLAVCLLTGTLSRLHAQEEVKCNCSQTDVSPAGVMNAHTHSQGSWMFSYTFMQMQAQGSQQGTQSISKDAVLNDYLMAPKAMRMDMHMLMAMYGVTDRLGIMMMLNYNSSGMDMDMLPTSSHNHEGSNAGNAIASSTSMQETASGIGDVSVYADYSLIKRERHKLVLYAGASIPTGRIHTLNNSGMFPGQRAPYGMQAGTGSLDLIPGLTYLYEDGKFFLGSQAYAVLHTHYNVIGYRWGNSLELNEWAAFKPRNWLSGSLRLNASFSEDISGYDPTLYEVSEPATNAANYGGSRLVLYPGINFYIPGGILSGARFSLEYGLPIYQNLNGIQMPWRSVLTAGLRYTY